MCGAQVQTRAPLVPPAVARWRRSAAPAALAAAATMVASTPGQVDLDLAAQYREHASEIRQAKQELGELWPPPAAVVPEAWRESLLLRFLVGFKYDATLAAGRFRDMLAWAAANDIGAVRARVNAGLQPADYPFRAAIEPFYPVEEAGLDHEGHPVTVLFLGRVDVSSLLLAATAAEVRWYLLHEMEYRLCRYQAATVRTGKLVRGLYIIDFRGFSLQKLVANSGSFSVVKDLLKEITTFYVEMISANIVVNCPLVRLVRPVITMLTPPRSRFKNQIFGGYREFKELLLATGPAEVLHDPVVANAENPVAVAGAGAAGSTVYEPVVLPAVGAVAAGRWELRAGEGAAWRVRASGPAAVKAVAVLRPSGEEVGSKILAPPLDTMEIRPPHRTDGSTNGCTTVELRLESVADGAAASGWFGPSARPVAVSASSQSMQQMRTALQHDSPNHLGLWVNAGGRGGRCKPAGGPGSSPQQWRAAEPAGPTGGGSGGGGRSSCRGRRRRAGPAAAAPSSRAGRGGTGHGRQWRRRWRGRGPVRRRRSAEPGDAFAGRERGGGRGLDHRCRPPQLRARRKAVRRVHAGGLAWGGEAVGRHPALL